MKLSIIIVNYNVEYFLEQCILSAQTAMKSIEAELIVVDNASVDGSLEMLRHRFPEVTLIANKENLGFSKANNQGIRISKGEYVLLLNPDTLVEESTFKTCIEFMDSHPNAGGLGIQMLDGKGNFLPESKRALPTPAVAFYKISGLSKLFPRSKTFGRYHLGNLDKNENHEVEILSGAYMLMRKTALDKVGLLDEDFFMYGEDIDLSYRLIKGGYTNHYLADARIIHYKGESTKKTSVNYVMVFYKAMRIFARKHFSEQNANIFNKLIEAAIYARAGLSIVKRFIAGIFHPLLDFTLIWLGLHLIRTYYEGFTGIELPAHTYEWAFPVYSLIWVIIAYLGNAFEHPFRARRVFRGVTYGTGLILIIYSLIPEELRFSRALILAGSLLTLFVMFLTRAGIHYVSPDARQAEGKERRYAVVGAEDEYERIAEMMVKMGIQKDHIIQVHVSELKEKGKDHLNDLTHILKVDEVVFCAKDLSAQQIMDQMSTLDGRRLDFKIAPPESMFIIGSNSKDSSGDLLGVEMNAINKATNRRNKRLLDFTSSLILFILSPILFWFQKEKIGLFKNIYQVFIGKKSWVGYDNKTIKEQRLPKLKAGVLSAHMDYTLDQDGIRKSNMIYAKDYKLWRDMSLMLTNWTRLGEQGQGLK